LKSGRQTELDTRRRLALLLVVGLVLVARGQDGLDAVSHQLGRHRDFAVGTARVFECLGEAIEDGVAAGEPVTVVQQGALYRQRLIELAYPRYPVIAPNIASDDVVQLSADLAAGGACGRATLVIEAGADVAEPSGG